MPYFEVLRASAWLRRITRQEPGLFAHLASIDLPAPGDYFISTFDGSTLKDETAKWSDRAQDIEFAGTVFNWLGSISFTFHPPMVPTTYHPKATSLNIKINC